MAYVKQETKSEIVTAECDSCHKVKLVQELPVENNAGEAYCAYLCKDCLIKLAAELE